MTAITPHATLPTTASPRLLTVTLRIAAYASGLLAGALVGVLLAELALRSNPVGYIAFHQATTVLYTAALPPLGAVMTICIAINLIRGPFNKLLLGALVCGIAGMLVTVLVNFPLNAAIMAWPADQLPPDFTSIATRWLVAHLARTVLTATSFVLVVSVLARGARSS